MARDALGGSFSLTATAGDVDGTVAKVEFLANGSVVGQATSAPYGDVMDAGGGRELYADRAGDRQRRGDDDVERCRR